MLTEEVKNDIYVYMYIYTYIYTYKYKYTQTLPQSLYPWELNHNATFGG